MDPQQWMGAVRMRVQQLIKITISNPHHSSPLHQLMLWSEMLCVRKKHLTLNHCLWPKYESRIHGFQLWKIHPLLSSHIIMHHHIHVELVIVSLVKDTWFMLFSLLIQTRWPFHWRKRNYGFALYKHVVFLLFKMLIDGLGWCGLLWCFYQLFGLILTAPIHCRGSIGEQVM